MGGGPRLRWSHRQPVGLLRRLNVLGEGPFLAKNAGGVTARPGNGWRRGHRQMTPATDSDAATSISRPMWWLSNDK